MMVYQVVCKRWFLSKKVKAITLYPYIFYNGWPSWRTVDHELVHIDQIHRLGVIRFYALYLWYSIRYGYKANPLEVEAYEKEAK